MVAECSPAALADADDRFDRRGLRLEGATSLSVLQPERTIQLYLAWKSTEQVGLEPQELVPASSMTAAYFRQLAVLPSEAEFPEILVQHQDPEPECTHQVSHVRRSLAS